MELDTYRDSPEKEQVWYFYHFIFILSKKYTVAPRWSNLESSEIESKKFTRRLQYKKYRPEEVKVLSFV